MLTYLVYSPTETLEGGVKVGGPLCIKTGSLLAYVGFATLSLGEEFCANWGIKNATIVLASELRASKELNPDIKTVVRFPDAATLARYKTAPGIFPCEQYFTPLPNLAFAGRWGQTRFIC